MKRSFLAVMLIIVIMIVPLEAYAVEEQPVQPQLEVLTLDKCLNSAYQTSKQLQSAVKNVEMYKEMVRQADANLWPVIGYQYQGSQYTTPQAPYNTDQYSQGGVSVTQNIYTGGATVAGIKIAKLNLANAAEDLRKTKQTLIFTVKSAYYLVWYDLRQVEVDQAALDNLSRHADEVKSFLQVGTKSKYDLLQAEVNRDSEKPILIKDQNKFEQDKLSLATTIGIDKDRQFTVGDEPSNLQIPEKVEFTLNDTLDKAYRDRPEIRKLVNGKVVAKLQTYLAYAGYKPKVSLSALYGSKNGQLDVSSWDPYWTFSANVTGNFFDGLKTPATVGQYKDAEQIAALNESNERDQVLLDCQQSLLGLKGDIETTHSNQANIDMNKESLRLTQTRYEVGMSTSLDIYDAQISLNTALSGYYLGIANYLTDLAKLDLNIGKD